MFPKGKSWQSVLEARRKKNFVGRNYQLKAFSENFEGEEPKCMIFAVSGEGGVGKSTLLRNVSIGLVQLFREFKVAFLAPVVPPLSAD